MERRLQFGIVELTVGSICALTGLLIMGIWWFELAGVAEWLPGALSMQFNTAVCFTASGIAFAISGTRLLRFAHFLTALTALVAALTLYQYASGADLGLDTLLVEPFARIHAGPPGRMSPNVAISFLLVSIAISLRAAGRRGEYLLFALSFAVIAIGGISLIGYVIDLDRAYDWSRFARMSPQASFCFVALGSGLIVAATPRLSRHFLILGASLAVAIYLSLLLIAYLEIGVSEDQSLDILAGQAERVRRTLSSLIVISGAIYVGLIAYAFYNTRRYWRSSASLDDSRSRLAAIIDNALDGIITIDQRGTIVSANPACERIFGYEIPEMLGRNVKMLMPEPYHSAHDGYLAQYERTGDAKVIGIGREAEGRRKDGTTFPLDLAIAKVKLKDGIFYSGVVRDISERRQLISDLAESRERLAAVIDNAVDGIISIDRNGNILSVNRACEQIFGYRPEQMIGQNVKMLMPEPYHSEHDGYLANYHRTSEAKIIGIGREVQGRRSDGSVFPLDLAVARVDLPDGVTYSGIVRDISERKRQETRLVEANAELEEFAYRTSHDLRSPVASSIGLLNISQEFLREGDHDALEGILKRLDNNFQRLDKLIQNIIVLTRNRLVAEENTAVVVRDMVDEVIESVSHLEEFGRLTISNHVDPQLTFTTKPSKFQVIVANLITNAIKYQDMSEDCPSIDIRAENSGGMFRFTVEDNGIGVPAASRPMLFRMFKRLHPDRSFGSGLGLYILMKSTESLGGKAWYEPREKGSRFIVELPSGSRHGYEIDPGR